MTHSTLLHRLRLLASRTFLTGSLLLPIGYGQAQVSSAAESVSIRVLTGARVEAKKATPYIMEYEVIKYPGGDVREGTGVCTDLVIRAFRKADIDLQKEVSRDRAERPSAYPKLWDNHKPDRNIDHRRCPNLVVWLKKHATQLPADTDKENLKNWQAGDVVFYVRNGASHPWHVGIVSDKVDTDGMPMIIDSYPPFTSESHRLDDFAPIHSHFRLKDR